MGCRRPTDDDLTDGRPLQRAGLITQSRSAQWRPCRLEGAHLKEAADWVADYRRFWDESFERLDEYLADVQKEKKKDDGERRDHDGEG